MSVDMNVDLLRDALAIAQLIAKESRWGAAEAAVRISIFVGEVRFMATRPHWEDSGDGQD